MIKTLYIVVSVVSLFVVSVFFLPDQEVSVTQNVPARVTPGNEFIVELTIKKGNVDGFSRLQQHLPDGFTAVPISLANAKFSFENNFVTLVWFALPDAPAFTIFYRVTSDAHFQGEQKLTGIFSYIEKDKTKTIDITPVTITLTDPRTMPMANASQKSQPESESPELPADAIQISRIMPDKISGDKDFVVELTVNNKSLHGSAKITEHIPQGWVAAKGETNGASFKVQDSLVKFIWNALPKDSVFKVTYTVKPGKDINALQSIYGTFAFDDHGTARSFDYFPSKAAEAAPIAQKDIPDAVALAVSESLNRETPPQERLMAQATATPSPQTGIKYRLQIAACRKDVKDVVSFNKRYHLEESVSPEMHEGLYKYVIGSFNDYRNARDMRLNAKEKIAGVFVVAYNNGQRIPVREALNATKEKWLQ